MVTALLAGVPYFKRRISRKRGVSRDLINREVVSASGLHVSHFASLAQSRAAKHKNLNRNSLLLHLRSGSAKRSPFLCGGTVASIATTGLVAIALGAGAKREPVRQGPNVKGCGNNRT